MTSSDGTQGDGMHGQDLPITDRKAQIKRVRRGTIVTYVVVLACASAVFAVMMLTATPSSSATAQSNTGSGGMPGMNHSSGQMPATTPSPTMADDMPGMDHGSAGIPVSSPSPTMADDLPGMDHGSAETPAGSTSLTISSGMSGMEQDGGHASSPSPTMASDMPGMDHGDGHGNSPSPTSSAGGHGTEHGPADVPGAGSGHVDTAVAATDRPLAPVLGTFGGASSAVMLFAAFLCRKDHARSQATQAARAARRTQK